MKVAVPTSAELRVKRKDLSSFRIQAYDADNNYPHKVINLINSSGTASSCTALFKKHLRGRGFFSADIEAFVVNSNGQKLSEIHSLICEDRARFEGFALHIGYNALLEVVSVKHIPFEMVRLGIPDDFGSVNEIAVHPDWMKQYSKKAVQPTYFDPYTTDPSKILAQIEKAGGFEAWKGHILYFSESGHLQYPMAVCDSVMEDVITDWGIKVWKNRSVATGFSASYVFVHKGKFENDDARQEFIEQINKLQGFETSHSIALVEVESDEQIPELKKFDKQDEDSTWEKTEETARENIIRKYQQPLALHAIKTPGQLGLSKEWEEAKINYDERTEDERNRIWMKIAEVMKKWRKGDPSGGNIESFKVIPITGFQPKSVKKTLSEFLTADAIKVCMDIVAKTELTPDQKVQMLIALYPIDLETANKIVKPESNGGA